MKHILYGRIRFLSALVLAAGSFTAVAFAQGYDINNLPNPDRPMFARVLNAHAAAGATVLTTWNGSFVYNGTTYNFNMVGTDPAATNTATTVQAVIIPVKIVIASRRGGTQTFDPETIPSN